MTAKVYTQEESTPSFGCDLPDPLPPVSPKPPSGTGSGMERPESSGGVPAWRPKPTVPLWKRFVLPRRGYWVTPLLVAVNVSVFLVMAFCGAGVFDPDAETIFRWGGNLDYAFYEGEYWRLLTSCFVHVGVFHLLFNMYALLLVGGLLEPMIGSRRFAAAYLVCGLIGSLASVLWQEGIVCAGASGAIFGLYGFFLAVLFYHRVRGGAQPAGRGKFVRQELLVSMVVFVGYNLVAGLTEEGVDNAAHIAGLLGGAGLGVAMMPGLSGRTSLRQGMALVAVATVVAVAGLFLATRTVVEGRYRPILSDSDFSERLSGIERRGMKALSESHPSSSNRIYTRHLDSCLMLTRAYLAEEELTGARREHFERVLEYYSLRREYAEMAQQQLDRTTSPSYADMLRTRDSMDRMQARIDRLLEELGSNTPGE